MKAETRDTLFAAVVGLLFSLGVHFALFEGLRHERFTMDFEPDLHLMARRLGLRVTDTGSLRRYGHGEVAWERRRIDLNCSLPECEAQLDAVKVELKLAKLGGAEKDPKKLPELQKYETQEVVEEGVNVEEKTKKVKPLPLKDFLARKAQLDKRRRKKPRKRDPFKMIDLDDDPRRRPTRFEKITGRLDGSIYGQGADQDRYDTYFGRLALEMHKRFDVPSSLTTKQIRKQLVRVKIVKMGADGSLIRYKILRRARSKAYTLAATAVLKRFMPSEGGMLRLPRPERDILEFVNSKGIIVDLDGRLFQGI